MKVCSKCGEEKLLSEFYAHKFTLDKLGSNCKECVHRSSAKSAKKYKVSRINAKKFQRVNLPWLNTYYAINARCNNSNTVGFHRYGGRGIKALISSNELKHLWFRDKAYEMKQPTIDRIDNDGNYTFDNCRYLENKINCAKEMCKKILQYDLEGNFIKEWPSVTSASNELNISYRNIGSVLSQITHTAGGFKWKYKEDSNGI
jgi:hypothetical protein